MRVYSLYDVSILLIRWVFGLRLIFGTYDNLISWKQMLEFRDFLSYNHIPIPLVSAIASVSFQFLAGVSWIVGYKVRLFSGIMIFNFIVALTVHIMSRDAYLEMAPAIHLLTISIFLTAARPNELYLEYYTSRSAQDAKTY